MIDVAWSVALTVFWFGVVPIGLCWAGGAATGGIAVLVLRARGYWDYQSAGSLQ